MVLLHLRMQRREIMRRAQRLGVIRAACRTPAQTVAVFVSVACVCPEPVLVK
jgi:hypothetical protein